MQVFLAGLRILARIEVRNGYRLVAPGPPNERFRGNAFPLGELVEDVRVGVERDLRGVTGLAGDLDDAPALVDQQQERPLGRNRL